MRARLVVESSDERLIANKVRSTLLAAVAIGALLNPAQLALARGGGFDAVSKRLDAMSEAIKKVRSALADFYASLSDEQKARFNKLGPPDASRQG